MYPPNPPLLALPFLAGLLMFSLVSPAPIVGHTISATTSLRTSELGSASPSRVARAEQMGYSPTVLGELTHPQVVSPIAPVTIGVTLQLRNSSGLDSVAVSAATPGSASYGHFLSRHDILAAYAPTTSSYAAVESALRQGGFTPVRTYSDHLFLTAQGTAQSADRLFSTTLLTGSYQGRMVVVPASPPSLPANLAPLVSSVSGLSQNVATFTYDLTPMPAVNSSAILPDYPHFMYGLDHIYNLTATGLWATGETIGLILWGDGYNPNDLSAFASQLYPSTQPTFVIQPVPLDGAPSPSPGAVNDPSTAPFELTLDMEWSESQAPGATLMPVYVPDGPASNRYSPSDVDLEDALNYLVNASGINVISMSFGAPDGQDLSFEAAMDNALQVAAARGVSVFASSGDNGGSVEATQGTCSSTPQVEFPATSPWITAVGGTAPVVNIGIGNSNADSLLAEYAWGSSTGGYSSTFPAPSWQLQGNARQLILSQGGGHRGVPDISGPSANNMLYYNSTETAGEGTSFASPMWGGIAAELDAVHGKDLGLLAPSLYSLGAQQENATGSPSFNDVVQGSNCIFSAGAGWDPVTGWGSPQDVLVLYGNLIHGLLKLSMNFNPVTATPGQTETLTVTATSSSGTVSGLDVSVNIFSQPTLGEAPSVVSSLTVYVGNSGSGSGTFTVPVSYAFDSVLVKAGVLTGSYVGSASGILGVSVLGSYWGPLSPLLSYPLSILFFVLLFGLATAVGWALGRKKPAPVRRRVPVAGGAQPRPVTQRPPPGPAPQRAATGPPVTRPPPRGPIGAPQPAAPSATQPVRAPSRPPVVAQSRPNAPVRATGTPAPRSDIPMESRGPVTIVPAVAPQDPQMVHTNDIPVTHEGNDVTVAPQTEPPVAESQEPEWTEAPEEPGDDLAPVEGVEGPAESSVPAQDVPETEEEEAAAPAQEPEAGAEPVSSAPEVAPEDLPSAETPQADEAAPSAPETPAVVETPLEATPVEEELPAENPTPEVPPEAVPEPVPPSPPPAEVARSPSVKASSAVTPAEPRKTAPRRAAPRTAKKDSRPEKPSKPAKTETKGKAKTPKTKSGSQ